MARQMGLLVAVMLAFAYESSVTDGYQLCTGFGWKPEVITEPQLIEIEAPGPEVYHYCAKEFRVPKGQYVQLTFTELDMGTMTKDYKHTNSCISLNTWIRLYENDENYRPIGHPLCGQTWQLTPERRVRRSTTNTVMLTSSNNIGRFKVQFEIVDTPGETTCPDSVVELSGSGTLAFPEKEEIRMQKARCYWKITAASNKRVRLNIRRMNIGQTNLSWLVHYPNYCRMPTLEVHDSSTTTGTPMQVFCFNAVGRNVTELTSTGNVLSIFFMDYNEYTGTGFEFDYTEI